MDGIADWLVQNRQWLFSGLGVAILAFFAKFLYSRFSERQASRPTVHAPATKPSHDEPTNLIEKVPPHVQRVSTYFSHKRLPVDDYCELTFGDMTIQVKLKEIKTEEVSTDMAKWKEKLPVAVLQIRSPSLDLDTGSRVWRPAAYANEFVAPEAGPYQSESCILSFHLDRRWLRLFRIYVSNINAHAGQVDIDLAYAEGHADS